MLWVKALHIVFVVTWVAGLFYLPRLFVYHAMAEDRQRAVEAGCESYLAKPIEPRRVVEEVEKLLARVAASTAAADSGAAAEPPAAVVE